MINFAIWKDAVYASTATTLNYYVTVDGGVVYQGRAKAGPEGISINLRRIAQDWMENQLRDFLPLQGEIVAHPDAMKTFVLYDADTDAVLETFRVLFDFTDEWNGETLQMNDPVNGHCDPRQKIFIGNANPTGDVDPVDTDYFRITYVPSVPVEGGVYCILFETSYDYRTITASYPSGVTLVSMNDGSACFNFPENYTMSARTFPVCFVRSGATLACTDVYQEAPSSYEDQYLTIEIISGGTLIQRISLKEGHREFSINGGPWETALDWTTFIDDVPDPYGTVSNWTYGKRDVHPGDIVRTRGTPDVWGYCEAGSWWWDGYQSKYKSNIIAKAYGNILSATLRDSFAGVTELDSQCELHSIFSVPAGYSDYNVLLVDASEVVLPLKRMPDSCQGYRQLFSGQYLLTKGPERIPLLRVPAYGFRYMYSDCSSLTTAPVIDAVELSDQPVVNEIDVPGRGTVTQYQYQHLYGMFKGCSSLHRVPDLVPTAVAFDSYQYLYSGCTALEQAPVIHARTVISGTTASFLEMFAGCVNITGVTINVQNAQLVSTCDGCSALTSFTCYVTDAYYTEHPLYFSHVLRDVAPSGTVHVPRGVTWWQNSGELPAGWTVQYV